MSEGIVTREREMYIRCAERQICRKADTVDKLDKVDNVEKGNRVDKSGR
mgnify:CR=1 FL=1